MKYFLKQFAVLVCMLPLAAYGAAIVTKDTLSSSIVPDDVPKDTIEVNWGLVKDAAGYEVEFKGSKGILQTFHTKTNSLVREFSCDQYTVRARSIDMKGLFGNWGTEKKLDLKLRGAKILAPANGEKIFPTSVKSKNAKVTFKWQSLGENVSYKIQILDEKKKPFADQETSDSELTFKLPVGARYFWHLVASKQGCSPSLAKEDAVLDVIGKVAHPHLSYENYTLNWTQPRFAETFDYSLERESADPKRKNMKKWDLVLDGKDEAVTQHVLETDLDMGTYRFSVLAKGPYRSPSKPARYIFDYNRAKIFPKRIELLASYVIAYRQYAVDGVANMNNFIFNSFFVSATAYYRNFGLFVGYEKGNRPVSFFGLLGGEEFVWDLRYSRLAAGPIYESLGSNYGFSLRALVAREQNSAFETVDVLSNALISTTTVELEGGPKLRTQGWLFYGFVGGGILQNADPFEISQSKRYTAGAMGEKYFLDTLTLGSMYRYTYTAYNYSGAMQEELISSLHNHEFTIFFKYIFSFGSALRKTTESP